MTLFGGLLCGIGWVWNSYATDLTQLYIAAAICGTGAGAVYGTCVGNSLKWFPDRRGLAAGLTAAGFGAGSALTVVPIQAMIKSSGYEAAFFWFGLGQGGLVMLMALFLIAPKVGQLPIIAKVSQSLRDYTPKEMLRTPIFYVMYAMFVMMASGGLMAVAQLAPIAKDFKIAEVPVSLFGLTMTALTFAATMDRILNGLTRPFFGWISDHIGRENTMFIAFTIEGIGIYAAGAVRPLPDRLRVLTGLVFFAWGEIYSLFPATCGDTFGSKFAATNAGPAVHGEGDGGADRALYQLPDPADRKLARRVLHRGGPQHHRSPHGAVRAEAHAGQLHPPHDPATDRRRGRVIETGRRPSRRPPFLQETTPCRIPGS